MPRSLVQIIFHVALETDPLDVVAPEFFQVRFGFLMDRADEPELGILQVEPMPGFEQVMDSFAFDQRSGKNRAENRGTRSWLEPLDVDPTGQIIKLLFRKTLDPKSVGGFLGENEKHVRQVVLFDEPFPRLEKVLFPVSRRIRRGRRRSLADLPPIAMPGWNLDDGRNSKFPGNAQ